MACVNPDGTLTESALKILDSLKNPKSPEAIADITGLPLFRIRSALRDLIAAGFVSQDNDIYNLTTEGQKLLQK